MRRNVLTAAEQELRDLIRSKLTDGMTPDQAADAVFELFHEVTDDWDAIDITGVPDLPGSRTLDQRWLATRVPRESRERYLAPDRSVSP